MVDLVSQCICESGKGKGENMQKAYEAVRLQQSVTTYHKKDRPRLVRPEELVSLVIICVTML